MFPSLDISTSALVAQQMRLNVISNNIANVSTTRNEQGQLSPYQAKYVVFEAAGDESQPQPMGVKVASVETSERPPRLRYQPHHPDARPDGYVAYPDINMMEQMTDSMLASRIYEANIGVIEVSKAMIRQAFSILA